MAKFTRQTLTPFAGSPGFEQVIQFGSVTSPVYTTNVQTIQALSAWTAGWYSATVGGYSPAIEDMNAVLYVAFQELCEILQDGIAYYDAGTTYYAGSIVNVPVCNFTVTSANATAGAVYTNNGQTFTVQTTISSGTTFTAALYGGLPTASGTLTKSSGTGDATITFSAFTVTTGLFLSIMDANIGNAVTNTTYWLPMIPELGSPLQHLEVNAAGTATEYSYNHWNSLTASGSLTIPSTYNLITGFLTIPVGDTYTVASGGTMCAIGPLKVSGTLTVSGTLRCV